MISNLIKTDITTAQAFQGVNSVRNEVLKNDAILIYKDNLPVGVLTARDIVGKPHNLIIDCMGENPVADINTGPEEALQLMAKYKTDVLLIYDKNTFVGLVYKNDILEQLVQTVEMQRHVMNSVVHDLRSPVNSITGIAGVLKDTLKEKETVELLLLAERSCQYANNLINQLLLIAEMEIPGSVNSVRENIAVIPFFEECVDQLTATSVAKEVKISMNAEVENNLKFYVDRHKIMSATVNLLNNAVKFTPPGGEVMLNISAKDKTLYIRLKDTGIGIPDNLKSKIFDKFTSAKRKGTAGELSSGLGMYVTKKIIHEHKGTIYLDSQEGSGTTFFITLPLMPSNDPLQEQLLSKVNTN